MSDDADRVAVLVRYSRKGNTFRARRGMPTLSTFWPTERNTQIEKSMRTPSKGRQYAALGLAGALCTVAAAGEALRSAEEAFIAENRVAMDKMMGDMDVKPSGDVDQDFAAMMIPHHQGAIDMAQAELRYGQNVRLRRIAQEIIVDQQQEIAAMRLALDQPAPPSEAAPDQPGDACSRGRPKLAMRSAKEPK